MGMEEDMIVGMLLWPSALVPIEVPIDVPIVDGAAGGGTLSRTSFLR